MSTENRIDRGDYFEVIAGEPTWENPTVWSSRGIEWKLGTPGANADAVRAKAAQALASNAAFLAIANPTNAQAVTQVQRLTREVNAIIRLLVTQQFDDVSDT